MKKSSFSSESTPITPDEALAKLEHFCAYRERSPNEVREKLKRLGMEGIDFEQIYTVLEADSFFSEERFAMAFAGGKFRINGWGKVKIRLELLHRGISKPLVEAALNQIGHDEYLDKIAHLARKKIQTLRPTESQFVKTRKTAQYLIGCGFEPFLVFEVMENISKNNVSFSDSLD